MPNYVIKVFPKDSVKKAQEPIDSIFKRVSATLEASHSLVFNRDLKKPRTGFDFSSLAMMDYGFKATYIIEKELIIPTVDGDVREYQMIAISGKYIFEQGILLISSSSDPIIEKVTNAWTDILFPTRIFEPYTIDFTKEQFHDIINASAKTVIGISHTDAKGLDRIQLKAFDLTNKEWYKAEGFDSNEVERISFIPALPNTFEGKTVISKMYRNGRFVIYQSAKFSEDEFEQIQLFLVNKIAEVVGSPLCKYGAAEVQEKLITQF
jgi:hypothetical protein